MKKITLYFITAIVFTLTSCQDFVQIDPPTTQIVSKVVYTSDEMAESAVCGIYSKMLEGQGFASGGATSLSILTGLSADEFIGYPSFSTYTPYFTNALQESDLTAKETWQLGYKYVYYANTILEGLAASTEISENHKRFIEGEARFVRAFCHFYLVNLYGPVPIVVTTDYRENNIKSRSEPSDVYNQIIADLQKAEELLPKDYSHLNGERVRPIMAAASALLARAYLYSGEWGKAEQEASLLIENTTIFSLVDDLNEVFKMNSTEAIWQLKPTTTVYPQEANTLRNSVHFSLSEVLLESFESDDARFSVWIGSKTVDDNIRYFSTKYKSDQTSSTLIEYAMVLRLAEQYLIRAEARAENNNLLGAKDDLNTVRLRAGLSETDADSKEELLQAILQERKVELFGEWGNRWLDLKRTKRADEVLSPEKGSNWSSDDKLYPIPMTEISNNKNLGQNHGY